MNVDGIKNTKISAVSEKKRIGNNSGGEIFASLISASDEIETGSSVISASAVDGTEAIFATQTIEDATARRARNLRAAKKGEDLLDKLEKIRTALLCGNISNATIISLSQALREKREPDIDPKLSAILDEIELRVEVELAKLEKAKKQ